MLRFPKGAVGDDVPAVDRVGPVDVLRREQGDDVLLVAVGAMGRLGLDVAERAGAQGIGVTVVDPRWVTPVAPELVELAAGLPPRRDRRGQRPRRRGRVGLSQALRDADVDVPARDVGIPPRFLDHGTRAQLQAEVGLTAQDVARTIAETIARLDQPAETAVAERSDQEL